MKHGTVETVNSSIILGNKRRHAGSTFPYAPVKGDRWDEYDALNNLLERWVYTGALWRSISVDRLFLESITNAFNSTSNTRIFPVTTNYNMLIANVVISGIFNNAPAASQNWRLGISYTSPPNLLTNITNIDTGAVFLGVTANTRVRAVVPLQILLDVVLQQPKEIVLVETRTAGNITKVLSYILQYYKVRV